MKNCKLCENILENKKKHYCEECRYFECHYCNEEFRATVMNDPNKYCSKECHLNSMDN